MRGLGSGVKGMQNKDDPVGTRFIASKGETEGDFPPTDELFSRSKKIDFVFRVEDTEKLPQMLSLLGVESNAASEAEGEHYLSIAPKYKSAFQAFVPIQTGCDNYCTFCIVPFTRGREWSRPEAEILKEVSNFAARGGKEVTLVGQNVNSYGKQWGEKGEWDEENSRWKLNGVTPFAQLLRKVHEIPGIERIRFTSSNPHDMTDDIIEAITTLPKVMPYLHLALQSGDDAMLKRMNRRHTYADFVKILKKIRAKRPEFTFSTDLIVGFCGETEEEFQKTLKAAEECGFYMIYLAKYSERKGTAAAKGLKDDISDEVKADRWHRLNEVLKKLSRRMMDSLIGTTQKVLVETWEKGFAEGRSEGFVTVGFPSERDCRGEIVEVLVEKATVWSVEGREIES